MLFLDSADNYRKYGPYLSTHDLCKFAALILMIIGHTGHFFFPDEMWLRAVAKWCIPVWFFLTGYAFSTYVPREYVYLGSLMILADFSVGEPILPVNIFATNIACRKFVAYADRISADVMSVLVLSTVALVLWPVASILFEYGSQVFFFALAGYYYRKHRDKWWLGAASLAIGAVLFCAMQKGVYGFTLPQTVTMCVGVAGACLLLHFYRIVFFTQNEPGRGGKAIMYISRNTHYFYALHFIVFLYIKELLAR